MSVTSLILGIDVSPRRLGWGLVSLIDGSPVACGMEPIDLPDHGWQHQQIRRAFSEMPLGATTHCRRAGEIQAIYIEQPWLSPRSGTKSAYSAGRAVQAAQAEVERRWPWAPIEYLQPSEWKLLAGLKGNASKEDVFVEALRVRGITALTETPDMTQDAADALLIAVAGWHRNEDTNERDADWQAVKAARDSA